jgi:hypothetical protein
LFQYTTSVPLLSQIRSATFGAKIFEAAKFEKPSYMRNPTYHSRLSHHVPHAGKKKLKKKKVLAIGRPSLKIKKRALEDPDADYEVDRKPSKEPKPAKPRASGDPPLAKKRKMVAKLGDKTFHQLIASSQERDRSGKFAPGFSPAAAAKLKKVIKKPIAIKTSSGGLTPKLTPKKKAATGGTPKKKVGTPKSPSSRKQLSPKRAHVSGSARALPDPLEPLDEALAYQVGGRIFEMAEHVRRVFCIGPIL